MYGALTFLAEPWFIAFWYSVGALGAVWVIYDVVKYNHSVNQPLKAAWPIIIFFFSVIGIIFYIWTCRPSGIQRIEDPEKEKEVHHEYVKWPFKKVTGSVIHCVAGDGLGIMTAMVIARIYEFTFWQEFWFEYIAGFVFGWIFFQYWAMRNMGNKPLLALWKGGRAEFFSMITVMLGMGYVMCCVTPYVVGEQPKPDTLAFWGFGALGLLVGYFATYPMNWWLVRIGWKHGMA